MKMNKTRQNKSKHFLLKKKNSNFFYKKTWRLRMPTRGSDTSNGRCCCPGRSVHHCRADARCAQPPCTPIRRVTPSGFIGTDVLCQGRVKGDPLELSRGRRLCRCCMNSLSTGISGREKMLRESALPPPAISVQLVGSIFASSGHEGMISVK